MSRCATWVCAVALSCFALLAVAAEKEPKNPGSKSTQSGEKKGPVFKPSKDTHLKAGTGSASNRKSGNDRSTANASNDMTEPGVRASRNGNGDRKDAGAKGGGKNP